MSEDAFDGRRELADAFDRDIDPLAAHADTFETIEADPFDLAKAEVIDSQDLSQSTIEGYDRVFRQWREFMAEQGRHPACPSEDHVRAFVRHETDGEGNKGSTVKYKLNQLNVAYEYWQDDPVFPHPTDYNPFNLARSKESLSDDGPKDPPNIPLETLRAIIDGVTHLRDRAIIATQLKLGLRATELSNIELAEVAISNEEIHDHYPEFGSDPKLSGHSNAIYIPHDRPGNKSLRPRLLPLDDELRRVLIQYLLVRPDVDDDHFFLSKTRYLPLRKQVVNDAWKDYFHPEYEETEQHRAVTSHFGRHFFTTYWRVEQDLNRDLVKYMRGDKFGSGMEDTGAAINEYIHTYYGDIRDVYLENIFKLNI